MSRNTHWACFDCRKSFHNPRSRKPEADSEPGERKCPGCGGGMWDMGMYFETPPRRARKSWEIARLLAESGYTYQTEGGVVYINQYLLGVRRPRIEDVRQKIKSEKESLEEVSVKERLRWYRDAKKLRR